jgi:hypothetical protein
MTTALLVVVLLAALAVMTGGFLAQAVAHAREANRRQRAEQRIRDLEAEVEAYRRRALVRVYDREDVPA